MSGTLHRESTSDPISIVAAIASLRDAIEEIRTGSVTLAAQHGMQIRAITERLDTLTRDVAMRHEAVLEALGTGPEGSSTPADMTVALINDRLRAVEDAARAAAKTVSLEHGMTLRSLLEEHLGGSMPARGPASPDVQDGETETLEARLEGLFRGLQESLEAKLAHHTRVVDTRMELLRAPVDPTETIEQRLADHLRTVTEKLARHASDLEERLRRAPAAEAERSLEEIVARLTPPPPPPDPTPALGQLAEHVTELTDRLTALAERPDLTPAIHALIDQVSRIPSPADPSEQLRALEERIAALPQPPDLRPALEALAERVARLRMPPDHSAALDDITQRIDRIPAPVDTTSAIAELAARIDALPPAPDLREALRTFEERFMAALRALEDRVASIPSPPDLGPAIAALDARIGALPLPVDPTDTIRAESARHAETLAAATRGIDDRLASLESAVADARDPDLSDQVRALRASIEHASAGHEAAVAALDARIAALPLPVDPTETIRAESARHAEALAAATRGIGDRLASLESAVADARDPDLADQVRALRASIDQGWAEHVRALESLARAMQKELAEHAARADARVAEARAEVEARIVALDEQLAERINTVRKHIDASTDVDEALGELARGLQRDADTTRSALTEAVATAIEEMRRDLGTRADKARLMTTSTLDGMRRVFDDDLARMRTSLLTRLDELERSIANRPS